jgi:hypothetical protein
VAAPSVSGVLPWRGLRDVGVQLGIVLLVLAANLAVRWSTLDDVDEAVDNASTLLEVQQALHLDWEHAVQDLLLPVPGVAAFCSWFYVWGYLPVVVAALVGCYAWAPQGYRLLRDALLASGAVGLVVYAAWPVAPPRLTALGYTDTVATSAVESAARPVGLANEIAAVPSFHVGWLLVVAAVLWGLTSSVAVRVLCVVHPALMCLAVVVTGNHWVLDLPAGAAIALVGLAVAHRLARRRTSTDPEQGRHRAGRPSG